MPGHAVDRVAQEISALFKLSVDQAKSVLARPGLAIRKGIDLQTAAKYQVALEKRGCACLVEPEVAQQETLNIDPSVTQNEEPHRNAKAAVHQMQNAGSEPLADYGTEKPYYAKRFAAFDAAGGAFKPTWNWFSLLFGPLWYLYKGLWAKGALMIVITLALAGVPAIIFWVYAALAGNYDFYLLRRRGTQLWSTGHLPTQRERYASPEVHASPTTGTASVAKGQDRSTGSMRVSYLLVALAVCFVGAMTYGLISGDGNNANAPTGTPVTALSTTHSNVVAGYQPLAATPENAVVGAEIVGTWTCQTRNPNGSISQDSYSFGQNGSFASRGDGTYIAGSYETAGNKLAMTARTVSNGSVTMNSNLTVDGTINVVRRDVLQLETVVRSSGNRRNSECVRTVDASEQQPTSPQAGFQNPTPVSQEGNGSFNLMDMKCSMARSACESLPDLARERCFDGLAGKGC
jgi:hypothetical protein